MLQLRLQEMRVRGPSSLHHPWKPTEGNNTQQSLKGVHHASLHLLAAQSLTRDQAHASAMILNLTHDEDIVKAIRFMSDNKIRTIKAYRAITGMGLKESKDCVDAFLREVPRSWVMRFRLYSDPWNFIELTEKVDAPDQVLAGCVIRDKYKPHVVTVDNGYGAFV